LLKDKTALITGAGSGFGEGMARTFVAEGAQVLGVDRDRDGAERVAKEIGEAARPFVADISCEGDVKGAVDFAIRTFGHLDILVNNAGIGHKPQPAEAVDPE